MSWITDMLHMELYNVVSLHVVINVRGKGDLLFGITLLLFPVTNEPRLKHIAYLCVPHYRVEMQYQRFAHLYIAFCLESHFVGSVFKLYLQK